MVKFEEQEVARLAPSGSVEESYSSGKPLAQTGRAGSAAQKLENGLEAQGGGLHSLDAKTKKQNKTSRDKLAP